MVPVRLCVSMWKVCDSRQDAGGTSPTPTQGNVASFQTENLSLLSLSQASTLSIVKSQKSLGFKKKKGKLHAGILVGLAHCCVPNTYTVPNT